MNLQDFNQSKYLAGRELPEGGLDLVIGGFDVVKLNDGTSKPAVSWTNPAIKPMLLNKTNRLRLEVLFRTSQTEALIGQRVGVYFDRMVQGPNGDMVGGLRLRPAGQTPTGSGVPLQNPPPPYQPGFQPNPAAQAVRERLTQPAQPGDQGFRQAVPGPLVTDNPMKQPITQLDGGNWTDEVPF